MAVEQTYWLSLVTAGLMVTVWGIHAPAAAQTGTATVTVKITVQGPPCKINNGKLIEVDFGNDVMTTRIDGEYKKRPVVYSVQCQGGTSGAVRMRIQGNGAEFDSKVLQTNKTNFGIALLSNGKQLPLNSWLNFTYPTLPSLEAVPVKQAAAKLSGGNFSAGATMVVEYR